MELALSRLSAALGVCARGTASPNHRGRSVSQPFATTPPRRTKRGVKQCMHQRNAIEGTISELSRVHGLRRSCYRGFAKVQLQNLSLRAPVTSTDGCGSLPQLLAARSACAISAHMYLRERHDLGTTPFQ